MARRTALAEASDLIEQFFKEVKADYMRDIMSTRQMGRRKELLRQIDMFDKVHGRAYDWLTSRGASNG